MSPRIHALVAVADREAGMCSLAAENLVLAAVGAVEGAGRCSAFVVVQDPVEVVLVGVVVAM